MELKRKELTTYPHLQAKWVGLTLGLVALGTILVFVSIDLTLARTIETEPEAFFSAEAVRERIRTPFYIASLVSLIAAGAVALLQLHGLLGPIKALEGALNRIRHGNLKEPFYVRQTDDLKDLASLVRAMQEGLRGAVLKDREKAIALKKVLDDALEKVPHDQKKLRDDLRFVSRELETLTSRFEL